MKITRRILACLLALTMVLTITPLGIAAAADTPEGYGRSILAQMHNADALLYAYDVLAEAAQGTPASISLQHKTHKITWDEFCTVYELMLSDHPAIFWHDPNLSAEVLGDYVTTVYPTYTLTGPALTEAQAALEAEVVRLTADLEGKSDYDKSVLLHDRLAAETDYVMEGDHQSPYGALVQGTAVCAGYAKAYQLLMQRAGIPAWYVTGSSVSPTGQVVGHAWNLVQLDGEWYYTDVTWDDQNSYTFYTYLNNTYAQLAQDHTFGDYAAYLPTATATQHNYFVRNNLRMETYAVEAMAEVIRNHYPHRVYITGDKNTFIQEYVSHLFDLLDALNVPPAAVQYGYASLGREVIFTLLIDHTCQYAGHTVQPTCTTDGYTVEICSYAFCHNERNRTVLPAAGAHVYDHACDADCNVCGERREVAGHVYDHACDATCNACGDTRAVTHVYDGDTDLECNLCGAIRPAYTPGDTNGDGKVNVRDLGLLQQFVNGWDVTLVQAPADVNGDGKINVRDLGLLQQFVNGWDVTLK